MSVWVGIGCSGHGGEEELRLELGFGGEEHGLFDGGVEGGEFGADGGGDLILVLKGR